MKSDLLYFTFLLSLLAVESMTLVQSLLRDWCHRTGNGIAATRYGFRVSVMP